MAGKENVRREIQLPTLFDLVLSYHGKQGMITGSERSDRLTGGKNLTMKGNGGADTYFVENSAYGDIVEIDNDDTADIPAQDTLILPWKLSETLMSIAEPWEVSNTFQSIVQSNPLLTDALARWNVLTTASAA